MERDLDEDLNVGPRFLGAGVHIDHAVEAAVDALAGLAAAAEAVRGEDVAMQPVGDLGRGPGGGHLEILAERSQSG